MTDNKLATFTANFQETRQFKAVLEPSSPQIGQPFKIKIYAPRPVGILSHYGVILSSTTESEPLKEEIIPLNGSPEYPVRQWVYHKLANNIVNVETRSLAYLAGGDIPENLADDDRYIGSIDAKYYPFDVQIFEHQGIANPGDCILWAFDTNGCFYDIRVTVSKAQTDNGQYNIILEGHDRKLAPGIAYTVRMFTSDNHATPVTVKCYPGTFDEIAQQSVWLKETVSFSGGKTAKARAYINSLATPINTDGFLFVDENYEFVTNPNIWLEDGELKSTKNLTGRVIIEYYATARLFNHTPDIAAFNFWRWGTFLAFNKERRADAMFDIANEYENKKIEDVIIVYRELVINSHTNSPFEKPSNWPDGNDYTGLTPLESEKPELGVGAVNQIKMQTVSVQNNIPFPQFTGNDWTTPTPGQKWTEAVIHIKKNYPATPSDDFDQQLIDALDAEYAYYLNYYQQHFTTVVSE